MRDLLAELRDEGLTVFVSSHLLSEIEHVADHLVLIREGRLAFTGTVGELVRGQTPALLARPEHAEDADVVADIASALGWPASLTGFDGGAVRVELPTAVPDAELDARAAELNRRAQAVGVVLVRLDVRRPTLEDAFFALTGTGSGDVR
jgi:ABC-2 type transport system ATP-binding protein